jgi:hypothetical protein
MKCTKLRLLVAVHDNRDDEANQRDIAEDGDGLVFGGGGGRSGGNRRGIHNDALRFQG